MKHDSHTFKIKFKDIEKCITGFTLKIISNYFIDSFWLV